MIRFATLSSFSFKSLSILRTAGGIEIKFALLGQLHQHGAGEGLADRADLKKRIRRNRQRMLDTGHAEPCCIFPSLVPDANRHARNRQAFEFLKRSFAIAFSSLHLFM